MGSASPTCATAETAATSKKKKMMRAGIVTIQMAARRGSVERHVQS